MGVAKECPKRQVCSTHVRDYYYNNYYYYYYYDNYQCHIMQN